MEESIWRDYEGIIGDFLDEGRRLRGMEVEEKEGRRKGEDITIRGAQGVSNTTSLRIP